MPTCYSDKRQKGNKEETKFNWYVAKASSGPKSVSKDTPVLSGVLMAVQSESERMSERRRL